MYIKDLSQIGSQAQISLHGHTSTILIDGQGEIPCLTVGIGSLLQKTLSENIKKRLKIYSSNLYWESSSKIQNISSLTIETICNDIIDIAKQLKLSQYILMGHSVFGGLAIEIAKTQPPGLLGVIGIGATPGWNKQIIDFKNEYFEKHASLARKQRFNELQQAYNQSNAQTDSIVSVNAYYAESAKYFAKPVTKEEIEHLWQGIECDDAVANHLFNDLLPNYHFEEMVDNITAPVLIAGGQKDYDSVPLEIWKQFPLPKHAQILDCGPVGHWPHLEAPSVFDQGVFDWLEDIL